MAELKTKKNDASVETFLNTIKEEEKRKDAFTILEMMKKATKSEPKMWGGAIIGLGESSYTLSNGKKNDWFLIGFSPRKQSFSLYLFGKHEEKFQASLKKLGKHEMSKGCLHIKKIEDIDINVLREMFETHVKHGKRDN